MRACRVCGYTPDHTNATVQALNVGATLSDSFTVTTVDGTQQQVTIKIGRASGREGVSGTGTGAVIEEGGGANATAGTPTASGTLTDADVDNTADTFTAVGTATASTSG